jgi:putative transposon-encoded protein
VWARVLKLLDNCLEEAVIKGMCRKMGNISKVHIQIPKGYVGAFVRIRVDLDINKKLERFVSITRARKKYWYQVKYEKISRFCNHCEPNGNWFEKCGTDKHDVSKFE